VVFEKAQQQFLISERKTAAQGISGTLV